MAAAAGRPHGALFPALTACEEEFDSSGKGVEVFETVRLETVRSRRS
jgi:hypothetical protein